MDILCRRRPLYTDLRMKIKVNIYVNLAKSICTEPALRSLKGRGLVCLSPSYENVEYITFVSLYLFNLGNLLSTCK